MPRSENLIDTRTLSAEEEANLATVHRWVALYNGDDMREFVTSTYHPDMKVTLLDGTALNGLEFSVKARERLISAEEAILSECPGRRLEIERAIPAGNAVTVEAVLTDAARPDFRLAWCAVLTFADGRIISDHSYLNHHDWPAMLGLIAPGRRGRAQERAGG